MKKLLIAMLAVMMCLAFAACGGGSGYGEGEQFQIGDETYALEKVVRSPANDTGSSDCYGVSFLHVGKTAPIIISGLGSGSMTTKSALEMTLNHDDTPIEAKTISFAATDEVEGYGSRVIFYFDIPKGESMPTSGILKDVSGSEGTEVEINLSGMTPEEETTTTTTTTTTTAVSPENLPVDPNYDPEANKNIGNTDVYEPIPSFDVSLPDTDF